MTSQVLKQYRKELNLTQKELASALCVTVRAVVSWETGSRNMPLCAEKLFCLLYNIDFNPPAFLHDDLTPELFPDI